MKILIRSCPRCGKDHEEIEITEFTRPPPHLSSTHWTMCPVTSEPVMLQMVEIVSDA